MPLRAPSGRAGRPWLVRRLETARRGADVLDQKRRALLRLERQLNDLAAATGDEWNTAAGAADTWLRRALVVGGEGAFELACFYSSGEPQVDIDWRKTLGVVYSADAEVTLPDPADLSSIGGGAALVFAAAAHRHALEAAARHAAASGALRRVEAELRATIRRLRAVERRWIPAYETALAALELPLDESEREQGARIRWVPAIATRPERWSSRSSGHAARSRSPVVHTDVTARSCATRAQARCVVGRIGIASFPRFWVRRRGPGSEDEYSAAHSARRPRRERRLGAVARAKPPAASRGASLSPLQAGSACLPLPLIGHRSRRNRSGAPRSAGASSRYARRVRAELLGRGTRHARAGARPGPVQPVLLRQVSRATSPRSRRRAPRSRARSSAPCAIRYDTKAKPTTLRDRDPGLRGHRQLPTLLQAKGVVINAQAARDGHTAGGRTCCSASGRRCCSSACCSG